MEHEITEKLVQLVTDKLEIPLPSTAIGPATPLFDGGLGLDSFAVVELITLIENHYDFEFSDNDFHPDNFTDLATLGAVILRYLQAKPAGAAAPAP